MSSKIIYSKDLKIPFCRILYPDGEEPYVELKNHRTKKTEIIPLSVFVLWLLSEANKRPA